MFIDRPNGHRIACQIIEGQEPGVVFLPGFKSSMEGKKALTLADACVKEGRRFAALDYLGHGKSSGEFSQGTISIWKEDTVALLDVVQGRNILVGSSMGGWMMLLASLRRPELVAGLVGIASAPDFTKHVWELAPEEVRKTILAQGYWDEPSSDGEEPTRFTKELIDDGLENILLEKECLPIECPIHLIHGMQDKDISWRSSLKIQEKVTSEDAVITLIKNGDHSLSSPAHLAVILDVVFKMLQKLS